MQRCNLSPPRAVSATATGEKGCWLGRGEGATEPFDFILDTNRLFRDMTVRLSVERRTVEGRGRCWQKEEGGGEERLRRGQKWGWRWGRAAEHIWGRWGVAS